MHADILDQRESLRAPFTGAVALHVAVIGGLAVYTFMLGHREAFGDPNAGRRARSGSTVTKSIPLPHSGPENPVAHDTQVASAAGAGQAGAGEEGTSAAQERRRAEEQDRQGLRAKVQTQPQPRHFKSFDELDPNKIKSQQAPAVSNPLFSEMAGAGRSRHGRQYHAGLAFRRILGADSGAGHAALAHRRCGCQHPHRASGGGEFRNPARRHHRCAADRAGQRDRHLGFLGAKSDPGSESISAVAEGVRAEFGDRRVCV